MRTKICPLGENSKELMDNYQRSEYLRAYGIDLSVFKLYKEDHHTIKDSLGKGILTTITGRYEKNGYSVLKILELTTYDSFPDMVVLKVQYVNNGKRILRVSKWINSHYEIRSEGDKPAFWSLQPSSSSKRLDWILPIDSAFYQRNYMGMNNTDYGGGIPVVDVWRRDEGIAIGHLELSPKLVSLEVRKGLYEHSVHIEIEHDYQGGIWFKPGDTISTYKTFVTLHHGDFFQTLKIYSKFMQKQGLHFVPDEKLAFEPVWCAWGYGRDVTLQEIEGTLKKVKELGFKWVVIDDGYQQAVGDWNVSKVKFPLGSRDMQKLVDKIHSMGLKAKLWWAPLAVSPNSKLYKENPDVIIQTKDGAPEYITWWNSYYMAPTYYKTIAETKKDIRLFLNKWGFDGLKMDGQHLNCVPPDYNSAHHLAYPEESCEELPLFFKMVYHTALSINPHAVIEVCPCGDAVSYFNVPYINQAVASDPTSSWQIRLKCKVYKAIRPGLAYYADHVELSDGGDDFASQIGIGGVPGSKFTWPEDAPSAKEKFLLTPKKEAIWRKWLTIYDAHYLSKGKYLGGLYDIGYDKPETHVIQKGDTLFYAFYAKDWNGNIRFRGLSRDKNEYTVFDYENSRIIGSITISKPQLRVSFKQHLLVKVY